MSKLLTITVIEVQCQVCGKKIRALTEKDAKTKLKKHVENNCEVINQIAEWDKLGVRKEMFSLLKYQKLDDELRKLMNKYKFTKEEIIDAVNAIEDSEVHD